MLRAVQPRASRWRGAKRVLTMGHARVFEGRAFLQDVRMAEAHAERGLLLEFLERTVGAQAVWAHTAG